MPRINKAIDLLASGQPVYYTGTKELTYENGRRMAQTWADMIRLDLEHIPFDMRAVGEFMRGLVDGGPTASGHRTPAVTAEVPTDGTDEAVMRANAWMVKQVLAQGVHGILLCHVESPGAARAFVEAARYSFQTIGAGLGLGQGRRGNGGQDSAAKVWGVPPAEYMRRADAWSLNPDGELLLGCKIENLRALENVDQTLAVPGLAFAEWGPGDMGLALGLLEAHDPPYAPEMARIRARVKAAIHVNGLYFLDLCMPDDVEARIDEGVMLLGAPNGDVAARGRRHSRRPPAW